MRMPLAHLIYINLGISDELDNNDVYYLTAYHNYLLLHQIIHKLYIHSYEYMYSIHVVLVT